MSKLWKQEWKYHLFFVVVTTVILMFACSSDWIKEYSYFLEDFPIDEQIQSWVTLECLEGVMGRIHSYFFAEVIQITFICLLVKKTFIYWVEQTSYGREFIQSLPIQKRNRVWFHVIMDLTQLVIPVLVYGMSIYMQMNDYLQEKIACYIPWLFEAFCGMMVTIISYMIMLLGVLCLMECIFVSGSMKLVGFIGTCIMTMISLNGLFGQLYENKLVQNIMGFFTMESAGGARYDLLAATQLALADTYSWEYGEHYGWYTEHLDPPVQYMGEWFDYASFDMTAQEFKVWISSINNVFAFSNITNYAFHVVCYLLIGFILIGLHVWLTDKKELSKDGFYFDFGRYLISGMIAFAVLFMITEWYGKLWIILFNVMACVIVFFLMLYLLDSNRPKLFFNKKLVNNNGSIVD